MDGLRSEYKREPGNDGLGTPSLHPTERVDTRNGLYGAQILLNQSINLTAQSLFSQEHLEVFGKLMVTGENPIRVGRNQYGIVPIEAQNTLNGALANRVHP
jgi:hypothetical protein